MSLLGHLYAAYKLRSVVVLCDPVVVLCDPVAVPSDPVAVLSDPVAVPSDPVAVLCDLEGDLHHLCEGVLAFLGCCILFRIVERV